MTFDEKIAYSDKLIAKFKSNELYDDLRQEIAIEMWVNPDADVQNIVKCVCKKVLGDEAKHQRARSPHLYNDDGECIDDDIYFVDQSTVEQGGVCESPVTDEMKEKVAAIVTTRNLIYRIFDSQNKSVGSFITSLNKIQRYTVIGKIYNFKTYLGVLIHNENKRNKRIAI